MNYRPEIDGLRAIAVVAVVLYHAEFLIFGTDPFTGGFIGVDVFFVISGYLITNIILKGIQSKSFSYAKFYERRARRILPALFVVMLTSIPFASYLMQPKALKEYAGSALASLFYASNVWFWKEDSYTAEPSALRPLLHTWSLSVEEQFYLVFPVLILLIWRFASRRLTAILLLLFVLSLQLAHVGSESFPDATFFLLPARGWELLAGAILAKLEMDRGRSSRPSLDRLMPALGLLLVLHAVLFFDDQMRHPSYVTLLPVLGTMLLIWFCKPGEVVSDFLSNRITVAVGLLSYGLYLWHFPVFAFSRIVGWAAPGEKILQIVLSVVLAMGTYFFVEKPTRDLLRTSTRAIVIGLAGTFILLVSAFGYQYVSSDALLSGFVISGGVFDIEAEKSKRFEYLNRVCPEVGWDNCKTPHKDKSNVLVVGDSMVPDAVNIMEPRYPDHYFILDSLGGCPTHSDIRSLVPPSHLNLLECEERNAALFDVKSLENVDVLVILNLYDWFRPDDISGYLEFLRDAGMEKVIVFGNYFLLNTEFPDAVAEFGRQALEDGTSGALTSIVKAHPDNDAELRRVTEQYGFAFISLKEAACTATVCELFVDGVPFTWDKFHLSFEFTRFLSELLKEDLDAVVKSDAHRRREHHDSARSRAPR